MLSRRQLQALVELSAARSGRTAWGL